MSYCVYIVRCRDNSLYTGSTDNVQRRITQHNFSKSGAKSLRGKLPVVLVHSEIYLTRTEALKREREIKGWRKEKKENLISNALALMSAAKKRV